MANLDGGFVGTEFQQRFDDQSSNDFESQVSCHRRHPVERNLVCGSSHSSRQNNSTAGPEGMVGFSWNGDLLRYLYCLGFVDSPSPQYEIPGAEVCR